MSLSEQIQRVDGSQNDIIKALAQSYGISTDSLKIDQVASAVKSSQKFKQDGLLSAATAALFGLTTDAVPDDVLQLLANNLYNGLGNQYVWGKYLPTYDTENVNEVVLAIKSNNTGTTFTYADSVSFDYDTGVIQFPEGSTTVTVWSYDFKTFDFTVLRGKYQIGGDGVNATWCRKFSDDAEFVKQSDSHPYTLTAEFTKISNVRLDHESYVNSADADAYPPADPDGYVYTPLGQLGNKTQSETGSYVGTGTFGDSNPNVITLSFNPKIVVIYAKRRTAPIQASNYPADIMFLPFSNGLSGSYVSSNYKGTFNWYFGDSTSSKNITHVSFVGNKLSWVGESSTAQANITGDEYFYIAIG